ncbi:GIY-YIG nuclease family protein [Priestia aryabhattai]|uniref:GIY-YIG nuclease family protein n=1 Tax=Priestia aryabhattai TaxID=412384 RepID=UPI0028828388|nr:GIY-YIG nuclease family protein [Priestia aryabhattai]MDT0150001.1 GIY-YIG nuclease family protein [Priestia aryabhattai]MDT0155571.1 GIY-YIG nuclease family protein [Priestia aryabhattai]
MFEDLVNVQKLQGMLNNARTDIPKQNNKMVCAIYFLYNKKNEVIYVGKSNNLALRLCQHRCGKATTKDIYKEIAYSTYIEVESASWRTCLEGLFIQYLQPKGNGEVKNKRKSSKSLSVHNVREIKTSLMTGEPPKFIAEKYGVALDTIHKISSGTTWKGIYVEGFDEWVNLPQRIKQLNSRNYNAA